MKRVSRGIQFPSSDPVPIPHIQAVRPKTQRGPHLAQTVYARQFSGGESMASEILVVSPDSARLTVMLQILADAGYRTSGTTTFEEGKRLLATTSPDLVIADERLDEFNGLHLILHGRAGDPDMAGIVTTSTSVSGLGADASRLGVEYVVKPTVTTGWLEPVSHALDRTAARRRLRKMAS